MYLPEFAETGSASERWAEEQGIAASA